MNFGGKIPILISDHPNLHVKRSENSHTERSERHSANCGFFSYSHESMVKVYQLMYISYRQGMCVSISKHYNKNSSEIEINILTTYIWDTKCNCSINVESGVDHNLRLGSFRWGTSTMIYTHRVHQHYALKMRKARLRFRDEHRI